MKGDHTEHIDPIDPVDSGQRGGDNPTDCELRECSDRSDRNNVVQDDHHENIDTVQSDRDQSEQRDDRHENIDNVQSDQRDHIDQNLIDQCDLDNDNKQVDHSEHALSDHDNNSGHEHRDTGDHSNSEPMNSGGVRSDNEPKDHDERTSSCSNIEQRDRSDRTDSDESDSDLEQESVSVHGGWSVSDSL